MATTTERGYGNAHQKLRRIWAARIKARPIACSNPHCKTPWKLIHHGMAWDLGHIPGDKTRYRGPEHPECNRATAGKERPTPPKRAKQRRWRSQAW